MPAAGPIRATRTAAFAAAAQRRGRLLRERRRNRPARTVATVFRNPVRPPVRVHGPAAAANLSLRLSFEWRVSAAVAPVAQRPSRSEGRRPNGVGNSAPDVALAPMVTRPPGAPVQARQPAVVMVQRSLPSLRQAPDRRGSGATVVASNQAIARPTRTPHQIAMVHRAQAPAEQLASAPTGQRPGAAATVTGWPPNLPVGTPPLTTADLPTVIDRVVHELDRRVTAARERKGWTA